MPSPSWRQTPVFDRLLFLLSRWTPELDRVLVIESGSRSAAERYLTELYIKEGAQAVDVLTCYSVPPATFDTGKGHVYFTHKAQTGAARDALFRQFSEARYSAVCMLCTGENIMTKWKWVAAARIPAKVMIVNESADSFWLDRGHWRELRRMANDRYGLTTVSLLKLAVQAAAIPFTLTVLLSFAAWAHTRRLLRAR